MLPAARYEAPRRDGGGRNASPYLRAAAPGVKSACSPVVDDPFFRHCATHPMLCRSGTVSLPNARSREGKVGARPSFDRLSTACRSYWYQGLPKGQSTQAKYSLCDILGKSSVPKFYSSDDL